MKTAPEHPGNLQWDSVVEDAGSQVGQFTEFAAAGSDPIVVIGGLGSNLDGLQGFARVLHEESQRPVAVVDVLRADRLRDVDRADASSQFYHFARDIARIAYRGVGLRNMGELIGGAIENLQPFDFRHYTELIDATVDRNVTDGPWSAVGHSWGGMAVQQLLIDPQVTEQIDQAALLTTYSGVAVQSPSQKVMAIMASSDRSPERLLKVGGTLYGGDIRRDPSLVLDHGMARDVDPGAYRRQIRALLSRSVVQTPGRLPAVEQPVLVMGGSDDPITPFANSVALADMLPNASLVEVEAGGHMFFATRPGETARTVAKFFDEYSEV